MMFVHWNNRKELPLKNRKNCWNTDTLHMYNQLFSKGKSTPPPPRECVQENDSQSGICNPF